MPKLSSYAVADTLTGGEIVPVIQEEANKTVTASELVALAARISGAQNSQTGNYTTVLSDSYQGAVLLHPAGAGAGDTFTIAANASVPYPLNSAIVIVNRATDSLAIAINSDTLRWAEGGGTGTRTLAAYGIVTAIKIGATEWLIAGTGLS